MLPRGLLVILCSFTLLTTNLGVRLEAQSPENGEPALPRFQAETIDPGVEIGYGLAIGDVDGDGRPDIILADKTEFVWYRNPDWTRFVMIDNLTPLDNVCIAARDITGDGKVEVAVGANWNPSDTVDSGSVHYLIPPSDRTQRWTAVPLHHEPTTHRMYWVQLAPERFELVVSPLHGRGNRNGEGAGVRLLSYEVPDDPRQPWKTTLIDDEFNMTHNLDPFNGIRGIRPRRCCTSAAKEPSYCPIMTVGGRAASSIASKGAGEIRMGLLDPANSLYGDDRADAWRSARPLPLRIPARNRGDSDVMALRDRQVLDDNLNGGHGIATGDLLGNGQQQIVAGWRLPNRDGNVGVKLYYPTQSDGAEWDSVWIDRDGMATEDLKVADLNGNGRLDIIAAGRQTNNLKVYWNHGDASNRTGPRLPRRGCSIRRRGSPIRWR
jgi:hypothetical protein